MNNNEPEFNFTSFTDILFSYLMVFVIIVSLIKIKTSDPALAQNVIYQVVMDWPGESKSDIDLWCQDPIGRLVGFKNREGGEGSLHSLAHDDLGARNDIITKDKKVSVNQEIISFRGTFEGEYVVNAHCYRKDLKNPEKITAKLVQIKPFKEIIKTEKELSADGDEKTFFRFRVDKDGKITETNELPQIITQNTQGS